MWTVWAYLCQLSPLHEVNDVVSEVLTSWYSAGAVIKVVNKLFFLALNAMILEPHSVAVSKALDAFDFPLMASVFYVR